MPSAAHHHLQRQVANNLPYPSRSLTPDGQEVAVPGAWRRISVLSNDLRMSPFDDKCSLQHQPVVHKPTSNYFVAVFETVQIQLLNHLLSCYASSGARNEHGVIIIGCHQCLRVLSLNCCKPVFVGRFDRVACRCRNCVWRRCLSRDRHRCTVAPCCCARAPGSCLLDSPWSGLAG